MRKVLEDLIFIGSIKETVELFGKKWTLETLDSNQQLEVMTITGNFDTLTRIYAIKNEILARSLKQIDDIPLTDHKETLEFVNKLQAPVVNKLYDQYEKLIEKQNNSLKELDEVKNS